MGSQKNRQFVRAMDSISYRGLLDRVKWYFETEDAMRTVRGLMFRGRATLATYKELSRWAGDIEGQLREEVEDGS